MKAIVNGRILTPEGEINGHALLFGETVLGIADAAPEDAEAIDARGAWVCPGLIDVHIHGCRGADVSDGSSAGLRAIARTLLESGVTAFLPTTMTIPRPALETAFSVIRALMPESRTSAFEGAEILGCHAEGPFINPEKKGAQDAAAVLPPDPALVLPWAEVIRVMTFAPEIPGAGTLQAALKADGRIALSVGHTAASFAQAARAFALGASRVTHLFNAMSPLHHRAPGTVGAALSSDVWTEVIADGLHIDPSLFPLLRRIKGDRLVLITDAVRAAGMPDGTYTLGGQPFTLRGAECRMADGTIAGSVLRLNEAVRNYRAFSGASMAEAVRAASLHAAASAGLDARKGSLAPGKDADITLMDDRCEVLATIVRGTVKYRRS